MNSLVKLTYKMASKVSLADRHGQAHVPCRPKGDPKCSVHRQKEVVLHCSECNELICITCSISTHNGHRQVELADITPQKKSVLHDYINTTEKTTLLHIQQEIVSVESKLTENDTDFQELEQKVKDHGEACKKQIDTLTEEVVSKSVKFREENRDLLMTYKKELEERQTFLLEQIKECKQVLQQGSSVQVYDETANISDDMSLLPTKPALCTVDFRPCQSMIEQLRKDYGDLKISAAPTKSDISTTFQDNEEYRSTTSAVSRETPQDDILDSPIVQLRFQSPVECTSIIPGSSGVWLSDYASRDLLLVDFEGHTKLKTKQTYDIRSITLSPNSGNVWFCSLDDSSIYEVPAVEKKPVKRFTANLYPEEICITKGRHVVVGSRTNITIYTTTGEVVAMTSVSDALQEKGTVTPGSISQCPVTSNIAVTHWCHSKGSRDGGVLRVYNKDLIIQYIYKGMECDFQEKALYDSRGNLILKTLHNNVHLVRGAGQHIRNIRMEETNAIGCIGIGMNDVLWISVLSEKKKMFARNTKSVIKTIKYYKT